LSDSIIRIVNIALTQVGEPLITSLAEETKAARLVDLRYHDIRDAVLRAHPWNCATKRVTLAETTETPAYGFTSCFQLPSDFIRLVEMDRRDRNFRLEGRKILADYSPVHIKYVFRITDVADMDDLLRQAIAARLAAELSLPLARSAERMSALWAIYKEKLSEARFIDSVEAPNDAFETDEWIGSRVGGDEPFRRINT